MSIVTPPAPVAPPRPREPAPAPAPVAPLPPRPDARAKARGAARYTQDIYPRHLLHGAIVRSPHAAARIRAIDTAPARAMPGVAAVLTAADVPDRRMGIAVKDEPLLARETVRYVGEPVAVVAAESAAQARAAAAVVAVEWEPLPVAITIEQALAPGAPAVAPGEPNLCEPAVAARGDVEAGFRAAVHVVETTIRSHRAHQGYIEPRATLAEVDPDGRLVVTTTSQAPFQVRQTLAHVFDLPMTHVVVRVPAFGGGFGGKLHNGMAPYASALALATRRPVQVVCSRAEELQAANPREGSVVTIESAFDADGRILARRVLAHFDSGAYAYDTPYIIATGALQACGPYHVPALEARVHPVRTHTHPTASFRAPSGPQMCHANELHMDDAAERLGLDRLELRRRNLMRTGSLGPSGQTVENPSIGTCMERVAAVLDVWRAESAADPPQPGRRRGYGIALAWWCTSAGVSAANARVNEDGTVTVWSGATEIGTGAVVSGLPALVAGELGIRPQDVRLVTGDTDAAPEDFGSEGSRTLYGAGNAVLRAVRQLRELLARTAAEQLGVAPAALVFADGRIAPDNAPDDGLTLAEVVAVAARSGGPPVASGRFQAPPTPTLAGAGSNLLIPAFNEPTFHCHGAEVEIDEELGDVRVLRYVAIHDTGPWIVPAGVRGQIEGGVVQGIGYALWEEVLIDEQGRTVNADLVDYRLPTIADVPAEIRILPLTERPGAHGPRGAKGIGEAPIVLPPATIASAVRDALGVRMPELPLTPERVLAAAQAVA